MMNRTFTQLNGTKKPTSKNPLTIKLYTLYFIIAVLIPGISANAQDQKCSYDYPIQWDWIQEIIADSDACSVGEIQAIFYNDYIQIIPGESSESIPCPSGGGNRIYDCLGNFICEYGGDTPFTTWCDQELIDFAMNDTETIWRNGKETTYPHNVIPIKGCPGEVIEYYVGLETPNGAICDSAGEQIGVDAQTGEPIITNLNELDACTISFTFSGEGDFIYSLQDPYGNSARLDCVFKLTYNESCDPDSPCNTNNPLTGWLQDMINNNDDCALGQILKFEYNGQVYFRLDPGEIQNGIPCPSDAASKFYTCDGELACEFGYLALDDPRRCDRELVSAALNSTSIWLSEDSFPVEVCPEGDPLEWDWIQNLIENSGGCNVGEITVAENGHKTYILTSPGNTEEGIPCKSDYTYMRFNCNGEFICRFGGITITDAPYNCNNRLFSPASSSTSIWTYEDNFLVENCPTGNPLQWDFVQDIINQNSERDGCGVNSIQQFQYNGSTFIKTTPGVFLGNGIYCPSDLSTYYYNCEGNRVCETGAFAVTLPEDLCNADINAAANNATTIWRYEDSSSTQSCPEGDPLQWDWMQEKLNNNDPNRCGTEELRKFEYNGNIYIEAVVGTWDGFPCPPDFGNEYYNCNGEFICQLGLPNPERTCDAGLLAAAGNYTTLWAFEDMSSITSCPPEGDPLQWDWIQDLIANQAGCNVGSIYQFERAGETYFFTQQGWIDDNGNPCQTDYPSFLFTCNGEFICEFGLTDPNSPRGCITNFNTAYPVSGDTPKTTIWNNNGNANTGVSLSGCPGDVFEWKVAIYDQTQAICIPVNQQIGTNPSSNEPVITNFTQVDDCNIAFTFNQAGEFIYTAGTAENSNETVTWTFNLYESMDCSTENIPVSGCTDASATNYNSDATEDDGSCEYENTNPSVFSTYTWLSTYVNQANCSGESITVYNAGSYSFVLIQNGNAGKLYFENGTYYCDETPSYSCVAAYSLNNITSTWTCGNSTIPINGCTDANAINYNSAATVDDGSCQYTTTNDPVFTTYPWLSTFVNQNNCSGESITVYNAGSYNFILIQSGNEGKLYFENGTYYCDETPAYSCVAAYSLNNIAQTWSCGFIPPNPEPGCTDANAINYNPSATVDDGSCQYENTGACGSYIGTFFYADCGGINYYFIRLSDGRVFDPYFADGIGINPREGQQIRFDYVIKTDVTTPCTISESPIIITCFEEISNNSNTPIFENYPWLNTLVNSNNCSNESITVYDAGSYNFIYVQNSTGNSLYYQDGTFYCQDAPGYSCVTAYRLSNVAGNWTCGETSSNPNSNPRDCDVDNPITDLDWLANLLYNQLNPPSSIRVSTYLYNDEVIYKVDFSDMDGNISYNYCDGENICFFNPFNQMNTCNDFGATFIEEIYSAPNNTETLQFDKYPWLSQPFLDLFSCIWKPQVLEFDFGNYAFVYFKTAREGKLYLDNGTLYCEDTDGQTCLNNYNLSNPTNTWSCGGGASKTIENKQLEDNKLSSIEVPSFIMYPNPTTNKVFIELPDENDYLINLMDISGKIMKQMNTTLDATTLEIDISDLPKGMYLVELNNELNSSIQKLILK